MITSLKFNNCFAFNEEIELLLKADMRTQKFYSNVVKINENTNILKSSVIYGPNNTGKTAFINCVRALKNTLLNQETYLNANIFSNNSICESFMSFIYENKEYSYEYKYDANTKLYLYEKMCEILKDQYNNQKSITIYLKDSINKKYECSENLKLQELLSMASDDNILIYTVQTEKFEILAKVKEILTAIANKIEVVDMNKIPIEKTIEILKKNDSETKKLVDFIKKADMYLEDYRYVENMNVNIEIDGKILDEKTPKNQSIIDRAKMFSVYKGKIVPSILFDSLGTTKFAALASYVLQAIEQGKILVIDELDSSLHFKITRAIISMFNNEINKRAQLIATLHDISLLDCKKMFRKEQIWFTDKDETHVSLYSLKDFSYDASGVRETSDIQEKYSKGEFRAIPEPDLISTLLEVDISE